MLQLLQALEQAPASSFASFADAIHSLLSFLLACVLCCYCWVPSRQCKVCMYTAISVFSSQSRDVSCPVGAQLHVGPMLGAVSAAGIANHKHQLQQRCHCTVCNSSAAAGAAADVSG
jgi:hypothetical protein